MSLPTEIIDHILSFLQSNKYTLKSCSQTRHPILSQLAERRLYANVKVRDKRGRHGPDELRKAIHDSPQVANYVRTLEMKINHSTEPFLEEMSVILPALLMLEGIKITYCGREFLRSSWEMPEKFRATVAKCLRLPSMMDISIEGMPFPLSTLSDCKHIRCLSLSGDNWYHATNIFVDTTTFPPIDSLVLGIFRDDSQFSLIANWLRSRHLSSLKYVDDRSFKTLSRILSACSHSLTRLDVNIADHYNTCYKFSRLNRDKNFKGTIPIPFSLLLSLEHLTIHTASSYDATNRLFYSPIPAITEVVKSACSLRRCNLDCLFDIRTYWSGVNLSDKSEIICILQDSIRSLLQSASTIDAIDLWIECNTSPYCVSPDMIRFYLANDPDLMPFIEKGKFILTSLEAS